MLILFFVYASHLNFNLFSGLVPPQLLSDSALTSLELSSTCLSPVSD